TMQSMRKDPEEPLTEDDITQYATDRANGYTLTLDAIFAEGKLRSRKKVMLTFTGEDGVESCTTCKKYKGERHRARWWISHDLVPYPGSITLECHGYQCQHYLEDDSGNRWTGQQ
ncbi:MAG: hypothetical protein MUO64_19490, partial [Anaerolineales bacterium]|nr:hypothetical protein [Anaerolineales bacterium]